MRILISLFLFSSSLWREWFPGLDLALHLTLVGGGGVHVRQLYEHFAVRAVAFRRDMETRACHFGAARV